MAAGIAADAANSRPPRGAAADDLLDALAALVVARHIAAGRGRPFPDPPGRDSHGLPIAIWTYRPASEPRQDVVMSARPGRVADIIDVPLPRPRSLATLADPVFTEMANEIRLKVFSKHPAHA